MGVSPAKPGDFPIVLNTSGTNAVFAADEIRVGHTWADVVAVPEPSAVALLGLSGLAFIATRLRRK